MRIALFGATGATGAHFLKLALEKDHEVVALVRSPEKITIQSKNIRFLNRKIEKNINNLKEFIIYFFFRSKA